MADVDDARDGLGSKERLEIRTQIQKEAAFATLALRTDGRVDGQTGRKMVETRVS